jgi:hypothetical protein
MLGGSKTDFGFRNARPPTAPTLPLKQDFGTPHWQLAD